MTSYCLYFRSLIQRKTKNFEERQKFTNRPQLVFDTHVSDTDKPCKSDPFPINLVIKSKANC